MQVNRRELGYLLYSRLESELRKFICDKLVINFGKDWLSYVPKGITQKVEKKVSLDGIIEPIGLLEETDLPDLKEIICYKGGFSSFISSDKATIADFQSRFDKLYDLRCKIAHVKSTVTNFDLNLLMEIAEYLCNIFNISSDDLDNAIKIIQNDPSEVKIKIPDFFLLGDDTPCEKHISNVPPGDYDIDGGFIGRKEDLREIEKLLRGDMHRVITIQGAGGVGKTAIAHKVCQNLLSEENFPFSAIVWTSAKEERLTLTGIEPIDPTLRNYEDLLDNILVTFDFQEDLRKGLAEKEETVNIILKAGDKGVLLVVDNLETIKDERIIEFIIDYFPNPNKVLITSRLGLSEVQKKYQLKEMKDKDAIMLMRTVANEKGANNIVNSSDEILQAYVNKMSKYPLVIKWVIGQVALGKDINDALGEIGSSESNITRFCFDHIFNTLLGEDDRWVLFVLAAYEKPINRGVLSHLSNLSDDQLGNVLVNLNTASLVIQTTHKTAEQTIESRFELLPLTINYVQSKLRSRPDIYTDIKNRIDKTALIIEEAERAGKQYRYSLRDLGAVTEEEKIAATWASTAWHNFQTGDYESAIMAFKKATQIAPNFSTIYRNWAIIESQAGYHERAAELMKHASTLDPNNPSIWFVWGNMERDRGRLEKAKDYLSNAIKLVPNDAPTLGALGEVEKRMGNFKEAEELFKLALKQESHNISKRRHEIINYTSLASNAKRWAELLYTERRMEESLEKLDDALEYAQKAVEIDPTDNRAQEVLKEVFLDMGHKIMHTKGLDAALPYFKNAVIESPFSYKDKKITEHACWHIVEALLKGDRLEEAKNYFNLGYKSLTRESVYRGRFQGIYKKIHNREYDDRAYNHETVDFYTLLFA